MTRGFITVATGSKEYYQLAQNLLKSYMYFTKDPMPFSIITDKGNSLTEDFDKVIVIEEFTRSTLDKFEVFDKAPYDETIYIEVDILAYNDLNKLWKYFDGCDDVSTLGNIVSFCDEAWFFPEDVGEFSDKVNYWLRIHGGVYFVRPGDTSRRLKQLCSYIIDTFDNYRFRVWPDKPVDETVASLAMSVMRLDPVPQDPHIIDVYPMNDYSEIDISRGLVRYSDTWNEGIIEGCLCVHFGNVNTKKWFYNVELYKLNRLVRGKKISHFALRSVKLLWQIKELFGSAREKISFCVWKVKLLIRRFFPKEIV